MKIKNLIFMLGILFSLVFALNFISADRTVNYNVYYGIIESNGNLTTSTTPVNGVNYTVYECYNAVCSSMNPNPIFNGYSATNVISPVFPEVLNYNPSTNSYSSYVIYVFNENYIGWEQSNITRYGNGTVDSTTPLYLSKKRYGISSVTNLSIVDETQPNRMIEINVNTTIGAQAYSAIFQNNPTPIPNADEKVNTTITMSVTNSTGAVTCSDSKNVLISYSGSYNAVFYCTMPAEGNYNVSVSSTATDPKILNSIAETDSKIVRVIQPNLTNYTYSLIRGLRNDPAEIRTGDNVSFSFEYLSNYVNNSDDLIPVNSNAAIALYNSSGIYWAYTLLLNGTSADYQLYNSSFIAPVAGAYSLQVLITPNSTLGNQSFDSGLAIDPFTILPAFGSVPDTPEHHNPDPEVIDDNSDGDDINARIYAGIGSSSGNLNQTLIELGVKKTFNFTLLFWILGILIFILLVAVIIVLLLR